MARRVLLVVVVLWASLAVVGGAVHLANEAGAATGDPAAKVGLGLCAVSIALFVRKAGTISVPPARPVALLPQAAPVSRVGAPPAHRIPSSKDPPLDLLLQVSRT